MKAQINKIAATILTTVLLLTIIPFAQANSSAAESDEAVREFVTRLYKVCLKRDPENDGLNYWVSELKNEKETGVAAASGFIFSPELQNCNYSNEDYVRVMYDAFFGREADAEGLNYWVQNMNNGMSRQDIFTGFANSNEFFDLCGSYGIVAGTFIPQYDQSKVILTNFFVERLYKVVLGRSCDKDGMMYWTDELLSGRIAGTTAAYGFFFSPEYENSNKLYSEYINDLYNALMGREADADGLNYWLDGMKNGSSKEKTFNGFAIAPEFASICSNYGIQLGGTISEEKDTTYTLRADGNDSGKKAEPTTATPTTAAKPTTTAAEPTTDAITTVAPTSAATKPTTPGTTNAPTPTTGSNGVTPVNTEVTIKESNLKIMNGCSGHIQFVDKNGTVVTVDGATFKSDNEAVAFACEDGTVVGLSAGTAVVTVNYAGNTSCVYVTVQKYVNSVTSFEGALTPQDFGAVGDGKADDTEAFRKMFAESVGQSYTVGKSGWRYCQTIFIPSGHYKITGAVFDENIVPTNGKPLQYCMFEIYGAGRESTLIDFSGSVLFDAQTSKGKTLFAFTTIRDIYFRGNNNNTFMTMTAVNNDGQQRMQFFSCGFGGFHTILDCLKSSVMLSEITFAYCKIANCGSADNKCELFVLTNPQSVNWRFDNTDIESFIGDAFLFTTGTGITINNGSIIPGDGGCVFNFDIKDQNNLGAGNAPQVLVIGARFEIHPGKTLLKTNSNSSQLPKVTFQYCNVNAAAENGKISSDWIVVRGGMDVVFDTCYKCTFARFNVNVPQNAYIQPKVKFINCPDMNVNRIVSESTVKTVNGGLAKNNLHITIDSKYDFYLTGESDHYYHTTSDLMTCRQLVNINSDNDSDYDTTSIKNGKTLTAKPYGYVEYVEITVPKNTTWKSYPVNVTLYDGTKKISDTVKIDFSEGHTYQIPIKNFSSSEDNNWVNELNIKFTHSYSKDPNVSMNITIVKK